MAAGCDEPQATRGRVEGLVRAGPTCPVAQQGQLCLPRAVDGEVQAVRDGKVEARARTSPMGAYELAVTAGDYTLMVDVGGPFPGLPADRGPGPRRGHHHVDIDCDTGVR